MELYWLREINSAEWSGRNGRLATAKGLIAVISCTGDSISALELLGDSLHTLGESSLPKIY